MTYCVVTAAAAWANNGSGNRYLQLSVANADGTADGTGEVAERTTTATPSNVGSTVMQTSKTLPLEEGQRVIVQVQQTSGASLDLVGGISNTAVEMAWVAPR